MFRNKDKEEKQKKKIVRGKLVHIPRVRNREREERGELREIG